MKDKIRLYHLDLISAFFIVEIILMHILQFTNFYNTNTIFDKIYYILNFYMPWFYFKSGLFHKIRPFKEMLKFNFRRLLVPFIVFTIFGMIIQFPFDVFINGRVWWKFVLGSARDLFVNGALYSNAPLWFLMSLFIIKLSYALCDKMNSYILVYILLTISVVLSYFEVVLPLTLSTLGIGIFFYHVGKNYFKIIDKTLITNNKNIVFYLLIFVFLCVFFHSTVDMRINKIITGNYIIWIIYSLLGISLFESIFRLIPRIQLIESIGTNSMTYYVVHWLVIYLIVMVINQFQFKIESILIAGLLIIFNIIILPTFNLLLTKNFKWLIGL
ncbi:MAG: acyltransferase family protein [Bacteroidia bacterium]